MRRDFGLGREGALAFWGMFFLEASFGSYMGIWPLWIERLGAPVALVGLILGLAGVLRLFVLLPSAALADRFGRRRLIVVARTAALIAVLSAALATHWSHLALMVVGSAAGELAFPLIKSHVIAHAGNARIRFFTIIFTVGPSFALTASPLLAGALIELFGLRAAFVLAGACTLASVACFSRFRDEPTPVATPQRRLATYGNALRDSTVRRLLILQGTAVFALALGTSLVPTFLEDERGLEPALISSLGALAAVGSTLFGFSVIKLSRLQRAPFVGAAIAVAATGLGFALFMSTDALALIGLAFILRGGLFSAWAIFAAAIGEMASEANRTRSFALSEIFAGLGFSLAPMVAGPIYAFHAYGPLTIALAFAVALLPILLLAQRLATGESRRNSLASSADSPDSTPLTADAAAS